MPGQCEGTLIHLETDVANQRDCQARAQANIQGLSMILIHSFAITGDLQELHGLQLLHVQRSGPTLRALRDVPDHLGGVLPLGMRQQ